MKTIPERTRLPSDLITSKDDISLGLHLLQLKWQFADISGVGVRVRTKGWLTPDDQKLIIELCEETGRKPNEIISSALSLANRAKNIKAA